MPKRSRSRYSAPPPPPPPREGRLEGRITIVQEDRFRLMDGDGRGYLFITRKRAASLDDLEYWRDSGTRVAVSFRGVPDIGALAHHVLPASD